MSKKYTKEILEKAVSESTSFRNLLSNLEMNISGSSHTWIKAKIISYGIDYSHYGLNHTSPSSRKKPASEILVLLPEKVFARTQRRMLLRAMLEMGFEYKCSVKICPNANPTWCGKPLGLDIDHIDGDWRNCKIENLRFLCPNCHSQTPSNLRSRSSIDGTPLGGYKRKVLPCPDCNGEMYYKSKSCKSCSNKKPKNLKTVYPPIGELIKEIENNSFLSISKKIGVSDNAVRKHLRRNGYDPKTLTKI